MATHRIEAELLILGRGDPVERGTVVVDGATIVFAGLAHEAPAASGEPVTEVPVVMPGLWECHGHFLGSAVPDFAVVMKEPMALKGARAAGDAERTLLGGVTSVREVGGMGIDLVAGIDDGTLVGPHVYPAGRTLSQTAGHGDIHELPMAWHEAAVRAGDRLAMLCDGVPECLKAVRLQLRAGAQVIKVHASGGVMSEVDDPIHQQFSDEELAAIVAEAARADRAVAAHCHGKPGIMAALRAGVRTIEHGTYLDEEVADAMKRAGTVLVPTRLVLVHLMSILDELPPYAAAKAVAIVDQHRQALEIAVAAGVTIAMGTDIFLSGATYGTNGKEIAHLVEAGMTPLDAIESATANGPLTLGALAPKSGRLDDGYAADLIALDFNPLDDVGPWGDPDRVTHVWKAGELAKSPA